MNTVLLFITLAFFAVVVIALIVILAGVSQARQSIEAETAQRDRERLAERNRRRGAHAG